MQVKIDLRHRDGSPGLHARLIWQVLFDNYRNNGGDLDHMDSLLCDLLWLQREIEKARSSLSRYHGPITWYWEFLGDYTSLREHSESPDDVKIVYDRDLVTIDFNPNKEMVVNKPIVHCGGEDITIESLKKIDYEDGTLVVFGNLLWPDEEVPDESQLSINLSYRQKIKSKDFNKGGFLFDRDGYRQVFNALLSHGWIKPTGQELTIGGIAYPICYLTNKATINNVL